MLYNIVMKPKSVSGFVCYVKDLAKTIAFYEALGFDFKKKSDSVASGYLNWYRIDFLAADKETKPNFKAEANEPNKGAGIYIYLSVDDVDAYHQNLLDKGLKPSTEPKDWPWGSREFVIRDPDGYKLVCFKRK